MTEQPGAANPTEAGIPTWEEFMLPILDVLADRQTWTRRDLTVAVLDKTGVSEDLRAIPYATGGYAAATRVGFGPSALKRARLIESPARAAFKITDAGLVFLDAHRAGFRQADLEALPAWDEYVVKRRAKASPSSGGDASAMATSAADPVEMIANGIASIEDTVAGDLIERLHSQAPAFFEQAVLDLLMAMGFGGTEGTATRTQLSNDGGIDGIIDQDALGLARIYVQAKRYDPSMSITRPAIQGFVGALAGNGASQGVFITTASFSAGAYEYADAVPTRVVLIDGERLARLMIKYRVGVQVKETYDIVEIDEDFFE